jgi:putative FmdB family regulatory protein
MPIYAYRCDACGHAKDVLQKMSDPLLTVCPECGADSFKKQVTAAGFQLKGSGWYVTDFRGSAQGAPADATSAAAKSSGDASPAKDAASSTGAATAPASISTPAAAAATPPAGGASGSPSSSPST